MQHHNIKKALTWQFFRLVCFVIYYTILSVLGLAILLGIGWIGYIIAVQKPENLLSFIIILPIFALIFFLPVMFALFLVKPLFSFKKDVKNSRVEVSETECPKLFSIIQEISNKTGCDMPKHVYLSPDVNAYVFYDSSFWSIFFPIRKNLEIGLGLCDGANVEELKAIIAHEFGHFSQNSMKMCSTIYVTNTILENIIYSRGTWDNVLEKYCRSALDMIHLGILLRFVADQIKKMTLGVYKLIQKGHLTLSRYMEYDADDVACQCVGPNNMISILCKIEEQDYLDRLYREILDKLAQENKVCENFFAGKETLLKILSNQNSIFLHHEKLLTAPQHIFHLNQKVKVENVWISHPVLADRIKNAKLSQCQSEDTNCTKSAWSLFPSAIVEKVSAKYINHITQVCEEEMHVTSDEYLSEYMQNYISSYLFDEAYRHFFENGIPVFDINKATIIPEKSPFNDTNAHKILEFFTLYNDYNTLLQVKNGEIKVKEIQIDGQTFKQKSLPIESFEQRVNEQKCDVEQIYSNIYAYVNSLCDEEGKEHLRSAYEGLFYAKHISMGVWRELMLQRNDLYAEFNKHYLVDEGDYAVLCSWSDSFDNELRKVISEINFECFPQQFINIDFINELKDYARKYSLFHLVLDYNNINYMFHLCDEVSILLQNIEVCTTRLIYNICKEATEKIKQ